MQNFLVCLYAETGTEVTHRVVIRSNSQDAAVQAAKEHFRILGVPEKELSSFTVEAYGQAQIESIQTI